MRTITVNHDTFGCESGCCGHFIRVYEDGKQVEGWFDFGHPYTVETPNPDEDWKGKYSEEIIKDAQRNHYDLSRSDLAEAIWDFDGAVSHR